MVGQYFQAKIAVVNRNLQSVNLLKAVSGGIVQASFERKASVPTVVLPAVLPIETSHDLNGSPPVPEIALPVQQVLPLYRRIGRRGLRMLRPAFLPLLTRFQARIASGMESSPLGLRLDSHLTAVSAQLSALAGQVQAASAASGASAEHLQHVSTQLRTIAAQAESAAVVSGSLLDRLEQLSVRLDDLTQAQNATAADVRLTVRSAQESARQDSIDVLSENLYGRLLKLEQRLDESLRQQEASAARAEASQVAFGTLSQHAATAATASTESLGLTGHLLRTRTIPVGSEVLCRTSFGWILVPGEDLRLVAAIAERGDPLEPGTVKVLQAILSPGDTAVDVGANIGTMTLVMAASVGAGGHVVAFEPTPRCADLLHRTLVLTANQDIVELMTCAIGAEDGVAKLNLGLTSAHNSLLTLGESHESVEVEVRPLDHALPPELRPAVVKIDVEGLELEVLRGMRDVLARSPELSIIVEFGPSHLLRSGTPISDWLGAFAEQGFSPWMIDEADGTVRPLPGSDLESLFSINLLMLRHPPARWPRLRVAS